MIANELELKVERKDETGNRVLSSRHVVTSRRVTTGDGEDRRNPG
jgi:hypothetical protein